MTRNDFLRAGLAGASALLLGSSASSCTPLVTDGRPRFSAAKIRVFTPRYACYPKTLQDIVTLVKQAESEGMRIRAVGSGHSFSDVAFIDHYMILPDYLNTSLPLDWSAIKPKYQNRDRLLHVKSGTIIRDINRRLDAAELALENLGGYDAQTIVGAVMTSTHGSGLNYGPLPSQVVSLQVVTTGGEVYQVEPSDGITDPSKFPGYIATDDGRVPAKLIQDDDWFHSIVVSMGCMGIVYSAVLRVTPKFWLRERRTLRKWKDLTASNGLLTQLVRDRREPADYYEILVNPYETNGNHTCIVTERFRMSKASGLDAGDRPRDSEFLPSLAKAFGLDLLALPNSFAGDPRKARKLIDSGMKSMVGRDGRMSYDNLSYHVFHLGVTNEFQAFAVEISVKLEDAIRAVERIFTLAQTEARVPRVHSSPISLRFVKASPAYMSPQYGRDSCMIEIPTLSAVKGCRDLLQGYLIEFIHALDFTEARPHWGLDLDSIRHPDDLARLYPKFRQWESIYRRLNAHGTFNNKFTDRIGLSVATGGAQPGAAG